MLAGGFDTGGFAMCPDRGNLAYVAGRGGGLKILDLSGKLRLPTLSLRSAANGILNLQLSMVALGRPTGWNPPELHPVDFIHQRLGPTATIPSLSATHREPVALLSRVRGAHSVREMLERVYTVRRAGTPSSAAAKACRERWQQFATRGPVAPAAGGVARSPARGRLRPQRLRQAGSVGSI